MPAPAVHQRTRRVSGLDIARAIAIIGMFAAHIRPRSDPDGVAETLYAIPYGRAAILFGLVAGVGVSYLAASESATTARTTALLLWRATVLLPLGLALQHLDHGVYVILADYAVLFLAGIVGVHLSDRWLLATTGIAAFAGTAAYRWGELNLPQTFTRDPVLWGDGPADIANGLLLSGPYPAVTWIATFAFGMWLGRRNLQSPGLRLALIAGGLAVGIGVLFLADAVTALDPAIDPDTGWGYLLNADPHSQTPAWLIGSSASAAAVLGICLVAGDRLPRLTWPLAATGQLAFTLYVLQLWALHTAPDALRDESVGGAVMLLGLSTVAVIVVATAWRAIAPRGPLEYVLRLPAALPWRQWSRCQNARLG